MIQWLRSLLFIILMYLAMPVLAIVYLPWMILSPRGAMAACHMYCRWVLWILPALTGLRTEVRGTPPEGEVMIAAKHQSFLDIILIYHAVPRGRFIMKRELMYAPIFGQYALRVGCIPVDRGKRGAAIRKMLEDVESGKDEGGQLVIYPQGTRVAPDAYLPYKAGTGALYDQLGQPVVPAATNVGVFWPRHGITRKPGLAVVEFLPEIPPGLPKAQFMKRLEAEIEGASDRLKAEARRDAAD